MKPLTAFIAGMTLMYALTHFNGAEAEGVDYEEAVRIAYQRGKKEAFDDIGLKKLKLEDVKQLIEGE